MSTKYLIQYQKATHTITALSFDDLRSAIYDKFRIPIERQTLLALPVAHQFKLFGTKEEDHAAFQINEERAQHFQENRKAFMDKKHTPTIVRETKSEYCFQQIQVMESSIVISNREALELIRNDKAVQHVMIQHKYSVGLLKELEAARKLTRTEY
jgi:hypothetical protein